MNKSQIYERKTSDGIMKERVFSLIAVFEGLAPQVVELCPAKVRVEMVVRIKLREVLKGRQLAQLLKWRARLLREPGSPAQQRTDGCAGARVYDRKMRPGHSAGRSASAG